jgi:hypothetical protein
MNAFRTISALMLALLVMISSTSFIIGVHRCQGEVQHIAFLSKAKSCAMEESLPPCHRHMKSHCCEDQTILHKGDHFKVSFQHIQIVAPLAIDIEQPSVLIAEVIPSALVSKIYFPPYDPPLRSSDKIVAHHVFLI